MVWKVGQSIITQWRIASYSPLHYYTYFFFYGKDAMKSRQARFSRARNFNFTSSQSPLRTPRDSWSTGFEEDATLPNQG